MAVMINAYHRMGMWFSRLQICSTIREWILLINYLCAFNVMLCNLCILELNIWLRWHRYFPFVFNGWVRDITYSTHIPNIVAYTIYQHVCVNYSIYRPDDKCDHSLVQRMSKWRQETWSTCIFKVLRVFFREVSVVARSSGAPSP